jgi:hypothetical protein
MMYRVRGDNFPGHFDMASDESKAQVTNDGTVTRIVDGQNAAEVTPPYTHKKTDIIHPLN